MFKFNLPIKIESEANSSEHWTRKSKRHKNQKLILWAYLQNVKPEKKLPCHIILIRCSPRKFDDDNLISGFKYVRDQIADYFIPGKRAGMADNDSRLTWEYKQEYSKVHEIKVEFIW
jgi:hypothetical protein